MIISQKYMMIFIVYTSQTYTYDLGGNRTNYFGTELEWSYGRTLTHYDSGLYDISYQYNADGMLTRQTVNYSDLVDFEFNNYYDGDRLVYRVGSDFEAWYDYDETGSPIAMTLTTGGTTSYYYFIKNLQGDVIAIADTSGTIVRKYNYDAWGKLVSITDGNNVECVSVINTSDPAIANPFRYRSYFYDDYAEKYWLQTRFYDPVTGRFINADGCVTTGQGVLSSNMYVYCLNNPVSYGDPSGDRCICLYERVNGNHVCSDYADIYNTSHEVEAPQYVPDKKYTVNDVHIYEQGTGSQISGKINVEFQPEHKTDGIIDPNIKIYDSYKIRSKEEQKQILDIIIESPSYSEDLYTKSKEQYLSEWRAHNNGYEFYIFRSRSRDVDLNNIDPLNTYWDLHLFLWGD